MRFHYISDYMHSRWLHLLFLPAFLWSITTAQAQEPFIIYSETFDQAGAGVLGPCSGMAPNTCEVFNLPQNEQWILTGDFSALGDSSFFRTIVGPDQTSGQLIASNLNTEICFVTRTIDISQFETIGFTLDISQVFSRNRTSGEIELDSIIDDFLEDDDYIDIKYVLDGDTTLITNYEDEGDDIHTKINDFGGATLSIANLQGRTLQIIVCLRNNATNELFALDNLNVLAVEGNPDLQSECPLRAVLILDESGSIFGNETEVRDGAQAFVDALTASSVPGSEPSLAVIEFSNNATDVAINGSTGYNSVDAAGTYSSDFSTYISTFGPPSGAPLTNWADALARTGTLMPLPELVVFFTDGLPTTGGGVTTAIVEANKLRMDGVHIYVVGVDTLSGFISNVMNISGLDQDSPPAGTPPPFEEADFIITDFAGLEEVFSDIPKQICNTELQVTKTISDDQFCPPDTAIFTIIIEDIMEGDGISAQSVIMTDVINNGYTYISNDQGATYNSGTQTLTWNIPSVPDGGSVQILITVAVNPESADHSNTVLVTAANALDATASFSDDDIIVGCTELEIIKTISEMEFCPPDTAIFTVIINDLPDPNNLDAENVVLTDVLGDGYAYISNDQGATFDGTSTVTWNVGTIPDGGSVQIQITAEVLDEPLDHGNTATADADNAASAVSDSILDGDLIVGCTELDIKKSVFCQEFCPPDTTYFTIKVLDLADPNNLDAKLTVLRDTIKNGYTYVSDNRGATILMDSILVWDIGTIPNETDTTITIIVAVNPEPADHANYATVDADNALEPARDGFSGNTIHVRCCPKGGGQIGYNQTLCGNGNDPDPIVGLADPSWGIGEPLVYAWLRRPAALGTSGQWTPIPGANQASYDPGPLSESTYFVRCVRSKNRPECPHQESNIVLIEVDNVAVASISGPSGILCNNQTYTFSTPKMSGIQDWHYTWDLGAGASPRYLHGHQVQVRFNGVGVQTVKLNVERQGCVARDQINVFVTNSSQLCGSNLISNSSTNAESVSIYPNPAKDKVFFELPVDKPLSGEVRLLQLDGKELYTRKITNEVFRQSIDLSTYEAGIYFIQIRMEEGLVFTEKVVKQ